MHDLFLKAAMPWHPPWDGAPRAQVGELCTAVGLRKADECFWEAVTFEEFIDALEEEWLIFEEVRI